MPSEYCKNALKTYSNMARCMPAGPNANNANGIPMFPAFMNRMGNAKPRE